MLGGRVSGQLGGQHLGRMNHLRIMILMIELFDLYPNRERRQMSSGRGCGAVSAVVALQTAGDAASAKWDDEGNKINNSKQRKHCDGQQIEPICCRIRPNISNNPLSSSTSNLLISFRLPQAPRPTRLECQPERAARGAE